jgi:hypothetical protein
VAYAEKTRERIGIASATLVMAEDDVVGGARNWEIRKRAQRPKGFSSLEIDASASACRLRARCPIIGAGLLWAGTSCLVPSLIAVAVIGVVTVFCDRKRASKARARWKKPQVI